MAAQTIIHREQGFKWTLPMYLVFKDGGKFFGKDLKNWHRFRKYNVLGYRAPKKGEWFLSGAKVGAYYCNHDFNQDDKFIVVQPNKEMYSTETVTMFRRM